MATNQKYTLDFIFQYSPSELDTFISQFTDVKYENLYDKRYMTMYYLYENNMLDKETEGLLGGNSDKFRQALEVSNTAQELRNKLTPIHEKFPIHKKINLVPTVTNFPIIVYSKNGVDIPADESFAVADYNQNSIVIYTTKEFSKKYKDIMSPLSPLYNAKLKTSATTEDKSQGWIFKKSNPNIGIMINSLTREDTFSKISKQPEYKKKNNVPV